MQHRTPRRSSRPRTMDFVARRRIGASVEFTFIEGERPLVARQTANGFFWDSDTPDPASNAPTFDSPKEAAEEDLRAAKAPKKLARDHGLAGADSDSDLAGLLQLLGSAYRR